MDAECLNYCLTKKESQQFEQDGFFIVKNALPSELVENLISAVDRLLRQHREKNGIAEHETVNMLDFVGKDELFLELLDWPKTFPKVWGILGWNIQLYHSHMVITPPRSENEKLPKRRLSWHQDSGRLNIELQGDPRPRVSLKVAFFLSDTSELGCGNFSIVPGSHQSNELKIPQDNVSDPEGALAVRVPPGTAVFFDRRLWHSASPNYSNITRKVLFYGYSYRWLRPRDDMTVEHLIDQCDPIRQQLLGASTGGMGYTSPQERDVPLKPWLSEHLGVEAVAP
ncbi:hypothetical protein CMK10_03025 [Candidatus Poribacteria bacterium]|jgi:hypothetical protein|nr:hypothetical protein [Candidatus Poribacteria bacterium]MEC8894577.1 phytanoyl-CoA dioxygenase family protein [Candidatus Poribacteria bacterium]